MMRIAVRAVCELRHARRFAAVFVLLTCIPAPAPRAVGLAPARRWRPSTAATI
jgi:hypothetical protein